MAEPLSDEIIPFREEPLTEIPKPPIKRKVWNEVPTDEELKSGVENVTRLRMEEFFDGTDIPPRYKSLGILSEELLITTSRELDIQGYYQALHSKTPYAKEPVIYAMALYDDHLDFAMTPVPEYGNFSLDMISVPLTRLEAYSGGISEKLSELHPVAVNTMLSRTATPDDKAHAKTEIMEFLCKEKPDDIKGASQSFLANLGIAYVPDGEHACLKLYIDEIPVDDPLIGKEVDFYRQLRDYQHTVLTLRRGDDADSTPSKIEKYLKSLPDPIKHRLMGRYPDYGMYSWDLFKFMKSMGYGGNATDSNVRKILDMGVSLAGFEAEYRTKILQSFIKGVTPESQGFGKKATDEMFKTNYELAGRKMNPDFSLTDAVLRNIAVEDLWLFVDKK